MAMITIMTTISKEEFLTEHNRLSPDNLQATLALLIRFKEEKKPLLKDNAWSIDKLRIPFISWLLNLPEIKKAENKKATPRLRSEQGQTFKNYPETHYKS